MEPVIERQRRIVAEHIRGENDKDWAAVYNTFVQDERAFYDVVPLGACFKGIAGVRAFYESVAAAVPDLHIEVTAEYDIPGCSIVEGVLSGTHRGEFAGIPPKGNRVRVPIAAIYLFDRDSGKLIAERLYYDQGTVAEQMLGRKLSAIA